MIRRGLEWFGGSVLVYLLVAACAASGDKMDQPWGEGDASSGATSSGDGDKLSEDGDEVAQGNSGGMTMGNSDTSTGNDDSGGNPMVGDGDSGGMMGMIMDPVPDADAAEDGTRIVNLYRTTADGLKTQEGYWDKELQTKCSFLVGDDGKERCLPPLQAQVGSFFSDSGCTIPVAFASPGLCPKYAYTGQGDSVCNSGNGYRYTIYEVGAELSTVYSGSPESCTEVPQSSLDALERVSEFLCNLTFRRGDDLRKRCRVERGRGASSEQRASVRLRS